MGDSNLRFASIEVKLRFDFLVFLAVANFNWQGLITYSFPALSLQLHPFS